MGSQAEKAVAQKVGRQQAVLTYGPGPEIPGGTSPGTIPGGPGPGYTKKPGAGMLAIDKAQLRRLQKRYAKKGDVTVTDLGGTPSFSLPGGKSAEFPSMFARNNGGRVN